MDNLHEVQMLRRDMRANYYGTASAEDFVHEIREGRTDFRDWGKVLVTDVVDLTGIRVTRPISLGNIMFAGKFVCGNACIPAIQCGNSLFSIFHMDAAYIEAFHGEDASFCSIRFESTTCRKAFLKNARVGSIIGGKGSIQTLSLGNAGIDEFYGNKLKVEDVTCDNGSVETLKYMEQNKFLAWKLRRLAKEDPFAGCKDNVIQLY